MTPKKTVYFVLSKPVFVHVNKMDTKYNKTSIFYKQQFAQSINVNVCY